MLVDVVPLRRNGNPLPSAQTKAAPRTRGMLQLDPSHHLIRPEDEETPQIAQLIVPGTARVAMPGLLYAKIVGPLRNWQFLVCGREDRGTDRDPVKAGPKQTWWCTVIHD